MLSNWLENAKDFFKRSEVILWSRIQSLSGFILAVFSQVDWAQVQAWDFTTPRQTAWLGIGLIANGTITELLRRRNMAS